MDYYDTISSLEERNQFIQQRIKELEERNLVLRSIHHKLINKCTLQGKQSNDTVAFLRDYLNDRNSNHA